MRKLLLPFSLVYWLGVAFRNWFFDSGIIKSKTVGVPVISVGNISSGGVGKTPLVELLIEKIALGGRLSVVSRGYGRKSTGTVVVSDGQRNTASGEMAGDEPIQIARKYPDTIVVVDENRVRGSRKAVELGAAIILLDDGFQHRYIHRDLNIVILPVDDILKGDFLLPAGNQREPFTSLKRADVIAVTRCADTKEYERVCGVGHERHILPDEIPTVGLKTILKSFRCISSNEVMNAEKFINKKVIAFSGIGNPKSFEDLMKKANVKIAKHIVYSDHHWYRDEDIQTIVNARIGTDTDFIITTEKDIGRLEGRFTEFMKTEPVIVAEIHQEIISGEKEFDELLKRVIKNQ